MQSWIRVKTAKMVMVGPKVGRSPPALCSGVTPVTTNISFTPYELGRAIAFCAFRHAIPKRHEPAHVRAMTALLDLHVEATAPEFALEPSAKTLKDFVSTYLAGVVATGLAYLFMEEEGYVWCGHFEDASGGNPAMKKSPDFVFEHQMTHAVALMESKGRLKPGGKAFATEGYDKQVADHLGFPAFGATATHGFCIGARLIKPGGADLVVVHTEPALPPVGGSTASPAPPPSVPERGFGPPSAVQRASFNRSMELLFGPSSGEDGEEEARYAATLRPSRLPTAFEIAVWGDREWVIGSQPWFMADDDPEAPLGFLIMPVESGGAAWPVPFYPPFDGAVWAFDRLVFEAFLRADQDSLSRNDPYGLAPPTLERLRALAREAGVSVGANGLALLHRSLLPRRRSERPLSDPDPTSAAGA